MLQGAVEAYLQGDYGESIRLYRDILEVDPKNPAARKGLKNAQKEREAQLRRQRDEERNALYAAQDFLRRGKYVDAYDRVHDILARAPGLPEAIELLRKISNKADIALRRAKPESSAYYEALGVRAYMAGDWFKAVDSWEKVIRFDSGRLDLVQKIDVARRNLEEQQRQDRIRVHLDMAAALSAKGLFPDAIRAYEEVLRMEPTNASARMGLSETRRLAQESLRADATQEVNRLLQRAMDAFTEGRRQEARRLFELVLQRDPVNRLAREYVERIKKGGALDSSSEKVESNFIKGKAFLDQGRYVEGIEALERHLAKEADDFKAQEVLDLARANQRKEADRLYREGLNAYSEGDLPGSIRKLQECLRVNPDYGPAKQILAKIMQEANK
jgi:cytochrome c-type biogenesis protein CcmH/NrfG